MHNGTTANNSEFGTIFTNTRLVTFNSDINENTLRLKAKELPATSTVYKVHFTAIRV